MRNITKIRRDFARLTKASLAVVIFIVLSFFWADKFVKPETKWLLIAGLIGILALLQLWLFLLCREVINRYSRARRDFLDMLETHDELLRLATDNQVVQNLANTPESIQDILVKCLDAKRRETVIRVAMARIGDLESLLGTSFANDELVQLEARHEVASLKCLIDAIKRVK